jgi:hypothetical protein
VSPLARDAVRARAADVLKAYAYAHQEWMIRATWGPLMAGAIELIARQRLDLSALAETPDDELEVPWDLEESGGISRPSPVRTPGLARQVAS